MGEAERGDTAPRLFVSYWCATGHETRPSFAQDPAVEIPEMWDCPRCGLPARQDRENPRGAPRHEPSTTHLAYAKDRRSEEDGAASLEEALSAQRARRTG